MPKSSLCKSCVFYIYSKVGLDSHFEYHCRFGFRPFVGLLKSFEPALPYDCRKEAHEIAINLECKELNLFDLLLD